MPNKVTRVEKRNLFIRLPEDKKERLKQLAKQSGMTLETYTAAVLEDAVANGDLFKFTRVRGPALAS